ncbi:MAG: hypothetical protein HZC28_11940 [Spirochaetes bacterium]|nr:hypothetical protein [Spirochaetota bacterium]
MKLIELFQQKLEKHRENGITPGLSGNDWTRLLSLAHNRSIIPPSRPMMTLLSSVWTSALLAAAIGIAAIGIAMTLPKAPKAAEEKPKYESLNPDMPNRSNIRNVDAAGPL